MANTTHTATTQHDPANPPAVQQNREQERERERERERNREHDRDRDSDSDGEQNRPYTSYPGGMASDPIAQLSSEISSNIKGLPDRMRSLIDSTPAFRAVMDQVENDLVASIAQSIRRVVETEVAKATGGYALTSERDKKKLATEKKIP